MTYPYYWALLIGMMIVTFALRASFVLLQDRLTLPPFVRQALTYVPQAVLAAIVAPALFADSSASLGGVLDVRIPAALLALYVAARSKSVLATLGVGMGTLWLLSYLANLAT